MSRRGKLNKKRSNGRAQVPSTSAKIKVRELPPESWFQKVKSWYQRISAPSKIVFGAIAFIVAITGINILQLPPNLKVINTEILRADDPFSLAITIKNNGIFPASIKLTQCAFEDQSKSLEIWEGYKVPFRAETVDSRLCELARGKTSTTQCDEHMKTPRSPEKGVYLLRVEYTWLGLSFGPLKERFRYTLKDGKMEWLPDNDYSE